MAIYLCCDNGLDVKNEYDATLYCSAVLNSLIVNIVKKIPESSIVSQSSPPIPSVIL